VSDETPQNPPLRDQFARMPEDAQWRLFRVLDVVIGMSHDEKLEAHRFFTALHRSEHAHIPDQAKTIGGAVANLCGASTASPAARQPMVTLSQLTRTRTARSEVR
jgi:hypothetical protein